ncbi:MAG: glycosyltransferase family 2 protein [Ginsengibacter sp.]
MTDHPLVTIGIPNYNYSKYILETLNSVAAQSYPNIELIIVDDASSDNSVAMIENWIENYKGKIKMFFIRNQANQGLTKVCNFLLRSAQGKYFQPLDADDKILPQKIEKQVAVLENSVNTAMIYSNSHVINDSGEITNPDYFSRIHYDKNNMPSGNIFNDLLTFNFISLPSVLINTQLAREAGGFDETIQVQDYYMWLRLSKKYEIKYLSGPFAQYRIHETSMSNVSSTNCVSEESVMTIKYHYYRTSKPELKRIIAKNIQNSSVYLYQHNYSTAKKWLTIAFRLNPSFKTAVYLIAIRLGVPFSFFKNLKSNFGR